MAVFWDFDGVIKDSVPVKSDSFQKLFLPHGITLAQRVRVHHEANGGSRYDKIPLYLRWAGEEIFPEKVEQYCDRFSKLGKRAVIDSKWIPDITDYLKKHHTRRKFFLVTATLQKKIEGILSSLSIPHYFLEVHGVPITKGDAIRNLLEMYELNPQGTVMIGDSATDHETAVVNKVPFLLRRTPLNRPLQKKLSCSMFDDFLNK